MQKKGQTPSLESDLNCTLYELALGLRPLSNRLQRPCHPCLSAHVIPALACAVAWDLWAESL